MRVLHRDGDHTTTLATEVELADSVVHRLVGLMFRAPLTDGTAVVFRFDGSKERSVHTLFVRAPIDVIWIDRERASRVETMVPWTLRRTGRCDTIVEVPAGTATDVAVGDQVRLEQ